MTNCLFCKMVTGDIKPDIVYEDEKLLAFRDIHPQAPVHVLIIPKSHVETLNDLDNPALAGHLLSKAPEIAKQLGLEESGYRMVINCKEDGGQEVYHLHLHLLGGRRLHWPPG